MIAEQRFYLAFTESQRRMRVFNEIDYERLQQEAKWGDQHHDAFTWFAILGEETGEAAKEALTEKFGEAGGGHGDLRAELVQAAAVLTAWIEDLDR